MTRRILRILGSRYGIAALLLLLVIAVVVIAKGNSDSGSDGTVDGVDPSNTFEEGAPNDGYVDPPSQEDGSAAETESDLPGEAVDNATAFAAAWVDTDGKQPEEWLAAVGEYATEELRSKLAETDPSRVPASEIRDEPVVTGTSVDLKTDKGLLTLQMIEQDGNWYVNGIDYQNP